MCLHAWLSVRTISEKPNRTIPMPNPNPESVQSAKRDLQELCQVKYYEKGPCDIDALPMTANQEYGFFHKPLVLLLPHQSKDSRRNVTGGRNGRRLSLSPNDLRDDGVCRQVRADDTPIALCSQRVERQHLVINI